MDTIIVKSEFGSKWNASEGRYCEISDSEALDELVNKVKAQLIFGYIPIGSPQRYDNGWFLMMYRKDMIMASF